MSEYTVKELCERGSQYAMAMLIRCIESGEPFVTYGSMAAELEHQLKIKKVFSVHVGAVAGHLIERIHKDSPEAPLINILVTQPNGIPGKGAGYSLANRYGDEKLEEWDKIPLGEKLRIIDRERRKIFRYQHWGDINGRLFGSSAMEKLLSVQGTEYDARGEGESEEHKNLKKWVASNPQKIGLGSSFSNGKTEVPLLSGDKIDVEFSEGLSFAVVEVKSCRSNDADLRRGIYQCVKYREVKKAEHCPIDIKIRAILVTERELNSELRERAKSLGIELIVASIDRK